MTQPQTLGTLIERNGVDVHEHLDREALVPVLREVQIQGDVAFIPRRAGKTANPVRVPSEGIPVVRGESGGNTHLLLADGEVTWSPVTSGRLTLGTVDVAEGSVAYMAHPEHGYLGLAPGSWEVRRQREQADEIRLVAD